MTRRADSFAFDAWLSASQALAPRFDIIEEFWDSKDMEDAYARATVPGADPVRLFESRFIEYLGGKGVAILVSRGREALRMALSMIRRQGREYVLVPAFCCDVVGKAILQAGMRPLLVDSGQTVGSVDWEACFDAIKSKAVVAVVIPHLFGLPLEIRPLVELARKHGVAVIEDCALCLGGKVDNITTGTLGDFSVFSFNTEKPIWLAGGGMLVCNPSAPIEPGALDLIRKLRRMSAPPPAAELAELNEFLDAQRKRRKRIGRPARSWRRFVRPIYRRIINNRYLQMLPNPFLSDKEPQVGPVRAALGLALLERYPQIEARRIQNYNFLAGLIQNRDAGEMMTAGGDISPSWVRAKLLIPELKEKKIYPLRIRLWDNGYVTGPLAWPYTMDQEISLTFQVKKIGSLQNAHRLARLSFDLPIHQNMSSSDLERMTACVIEVLA